MNEVSRAAHDARVAAFDRWWKVCTHNGVLPAQREALAREAYYAAWGGAALSPPEPTEGQRIQEIMERHAPDGFDPASDDMTIPFAIKIGELEEQLAALRAMPLQERVSQDIIGASVSVDVSINDETAGDRIFARVVETMPGSDGKPVLLCEFESDTRSMLAEQHTTEAKS